MNKKPINTKTSVGFYDPKKTFEENFKAGPFPQTNFKKYVNTSEPSYEFLGHKVNSPFGIPAGSLPTSKHIKFAFESGFDVVCYKTMRSVEFEANEFPNVVFVDIDGNLTKDIATRGLIGKDEPKRPLNKISITNSFGNPGYGPNYWQDDLRKALTYEGKGQLLIMSVVGTIQKGFSEEDYYDDFAKAAKIANETGVKAIEVNLSCPNVASEGILCYTKSAVVEVCKRVKKAIKDTPMIVKFGYFSQEQESLLEETLSEINDYISAVSAINTIPAKVVDEKGNQKLPGENRLNAGICGAGIKWAGLDMVERLDRIRKNNNYKWQIIGVGGVMTPDDFKEYRSAGADVVQSATGSMWNPNLAAEIKSSL